jgi:hypothetical protein
VNVGPLHFSPGVFWLLPAILVVLIILRFFQSRRQEMLAGSLLLWRRLAAQQPKIRPKRVIIDRSLVLQFLALSCFIAALASPTWALQQESGRRILLVIDNSVASRAQQQDKTQLIKYVRDAANKTLAHLESRDRVSVAASAPIPKLRSANVLRVTDARAELNAIAPSLSALTPAQIISFAADRANTLGDGSPLPYVVVSLQNAPEGVPESQWICCAPNTTLANVGIVEFGAVPVGDKVQVLVRLKNYSPAAATGRVQCRLMGSENPPAQEEPLELQADATDAVVFSVPNGSGADTHLRITWIAADGKPDALPDDDVIIAVPRKVAAPRVRFHAPVPALEQLYREALNAEIITGDAPASDTPIDLEVFVRTPPESIPATSRALMLLAPSTGYRTIFDVGSAPLENPQPQRDKENELTRGMAEGVQSPFTLRRAVELKPTGDFESLVIDRVSHRTLIASFVEDARRRGYVLAFVPGEGFSAERRLEPSLAALLVRMALNSAGSGDPFVVQRIAQIERRLETPLPVDWWSRATIYATGGIGLLEESASRLPLGKATSADAGLSNLPPSAFGETIDLAPWLIAIGLVLCVLELWSQRPRTSTAAKTAGTAKVN